MKNRFLLKAAACLLLMTTATTQNVWAQDSSDATDGETCNHVPGKPLYNWFLLDNKFCCQGKIFCTLCEQMLDVANATVTSEVTLQPSCVDFGEITYTATFSTPGYETQTEVFDNIPPVGHTWGDPTYDWGEDDDWSHIAHCTASHECSVCHAIESENGSVTWLYEHNDRDRTCTEGSGNGYEATFTNEAFTTQTWCTGLGPLGHNWNIPDANWDYMPCSRHITCYRCDFERTVFATMTYDVITAPTCTTSGEYFYHATFDFPTDNLPYPDVNVESRYYQIPCLGHEYDTAPTWKWDSDYVTATAVFTCSRCTGTADANASVTHTDGITHDAHVTFNDGDYDDEKTTPHYLVLDETAANNWQICESYNADNKGVLRDVLILCTLRKDNTWNALCLPFAVKDLENSPLAGAVVKTLDKENTVMTGNNVHIAFTAPVTQLKAGVPYIVKWETGEDLINPRFTGITDFVHPHSIYSEDGGTIFEGYYDSFDTNAGNADNYYLTAENNLEQATEPSTQNGFRTFFSFFPNSSTPPLTFDLSFEDIELMGMEALNAERSILNGSTVYDLQGRRVTQHSTLNTQLPQGLYIVNGHKVLIK